MVFKFKQKRVIIRKWAVIAICLSILLFLFFLFGKEKIMPGKDPQSSGETLMDAYEIGGESIPSLSEALAEGETADLTSEEVAADSEASGSDEEYIYHYYGLTSGGRTAEKYVALITAKDIGFQVVDKEGKAAEFPDFTAEEGSVNLAKAASEEGRLLKVEAAWTTEKCDVTVSRSEGTITEEEVKPLKVSDAIRYLESLPPSALGLEGDSMSKYRVYALEGKVMVNGALNLLDLQKQFVSAIRVVFSFSIS